MNDFVYLPGIDRVLFLDHIEQIEVFREDLEVKRLGIYLYTKPCMVRHSEDIKVLCNYFMIPLVKKED
jgi:hypothetical protein